MLRGQWRELCCVQRLGEDLPFIHARQLTSDFVVQFGVGDDPERLGCRELSRRATVCWIMVCLPSSASNCLARRLRLSGQKRVPRPPARITGKNVGFALVTSVLFVSIVPTARCLAFVLPRIYVRGQSCSALPELGGQDIQLLARPRVFSKQTVRQDN